MILSYLGSSEGLFWLDSLWALQLFDLAQKEEHGIPKFQDPSRPCCAGFAAPRFLGYAQYWHIVADILFKVSLLILSSPFYHPKFNLVDLLTHLGKAWMSFSYWPRLFQRFSASAAQNFLIQSWISFRLNVEVYLMLTSPFWLAYYVYYNQNIKFWIKIIYW